MAQRWGPDFHKKVLMCGGSAGSVFAISIAMGKSVEFMDQLYSNLAVRVMRKSPIYFGSYYLEKSMRKLFLENPNAYKQLEGRCCFGTTAFFAQHRWHVSWESNEDLLKCMQGSYHIPLYCKKNVGIKGVEVVDGAYGFRGENLPHGDQTLYVGIDPFAEITRTLTNTEMFYPAVGKEYDDMVQSGFDAMMAWDGTMNKKVGRRVPNYSALYVLWTMKCVEEGVYAIIRLLSSVLYLLRFLLVAIGLLSASKTKTY
mmetsp:Transcript_26682/g.57532  ORF Transcript_26682/g.57532 Transcript_26682/m.57532 type:complete len:256 (+) Transcript_26682:335-1102(+)